MGSATVSTFACRAGGMEELSGEPHHEVRGRGRPAGFHEVLDGGIEAQGGVVLEGDSDRFRPWVLTD
ncbi:hypothetical protein VR44_32125 [Streptomyces katrae]|uniref:Uncharacterized protein n=1 Tax=Streptomyces katrae TaxID=68223 RepID=A0A0F4IU78_9ACTN|nr:hypothetical protein VR44_32125 [Streptomyces katrae]